jgi:creatinine amidohydrolase
MAMKKNLYLHDMTYVDVAEYLKRCDVVMVAMGSLERHGAHIPRLRLVTTWEVVKRASEKAVIYAHHSYGYSSPYA